MKYSKHIGVFDALALMAFCWLPWVHIPVINQTITGFFTTGTIYGKPALMHYIVSIPAIVLFLIPQVWAKRTNLFLCAFNLAWSIRNFLLITHCELGECPELKVGIYGTVFFSAVMMVMSLFPKVILRSEKMHA